MVGVSASINLPLHHKVQKFSSDTGSPGWSRKNGRKMVAVWWWSRPLLRCCWQYSYLLLIIAKIIVQWQSLMETPNPACYQLMINMINSAMHTKAFHMRPVMQLKWYYVITSRIHTSRENMTLSIWFSCFNWESSGIIWTGFYRQDGLPITQSKCQSSEWTQCTNASQTKSSPTTSHSFSSTNSTGNIRQACFMPALACQ